MEFGLADSRPGAHSCLDGPWSWHLGGLSHQQVSRSFPPDSIWGTIVDVHHACFFPVSGIADAEYRSLIWLNPLAGVIESFRCIFSGATVPWAILAYDAVVAIVLLLLGTLVFNRIEKDFVDNL